MSQAERRTLKNLKLTKKYHWSYIGSWVLTNVFLVLMTDVFLLTFVVVSPADALPVSPSIMIWIGALGAGFVIGALVLLGAISAHRMAGAHIRLAQTFSAVGDGDFGATLVFRAADKLDDVERAFAEMMKSLEEGVKTPPEPKPTVDLNKEKRTLNSLRLTKRHHFSYMGTWVLLTFSLLVVTFLSGMCCLYYMEFLGSTLPIGKLAVGLAVTVVALCAVFLVHGLQTAHRLAGVHVKVEGVLNDLRDGRRDLTLHFRATDKLEQVEEAFANMLSAIKAREASSS